MKKTILSVSLIALLSVSLSFTSCKKEDPKDDTPVVVEGVKEIKDVVVKKGETYTIKKADKNTLTGSIIVEEGGKLVVEAGSKINCIGGTNAYITVKQGGKIDIQGTKVAPVVFTNDEKKIQGWGGIVLAGNAPVNIPNGKGTLEVGGNFPYGGNTANDNSGSIKYCRIEYSGAKFSDEKEYNGLSLFGVGSGTVLENISIIDGADDGIEFFGGTANVKNLILLGNEDDQFDWTEGWSGTAENVYAKRRADGTGNRGIEADSNKNNNAAEPISNPTIKNVTLIGSKDGKESQAVKLRVGSQGTFENVVISNWKRGFDFESKQTIDWFTKGKISKVKFENVEKNLVVITKETKTKENGEKEEVKVEKDASEFDIVVNSDDTAKGAGNGTEFPSWATGWAELSK